MELFEAGESIIFPCQEEDPFVACIVINDDEMVVVTLYRPCFHGASQVHVDKAECFGLAVCRNRKLHRVDFLNREPSQVERTRLCDGSIFSERRWSADQERCPSWACNVSIGT